jgi:hypothetical protein
MHRSRAACSCCGRRSTASRALDGEFLNPLASTVSAKALEIVKQTFPMRPTMENMVGAAALTRAVDNLADMLADPEYAHDFALAGCAQRTCGADAAGMAIESATIAVSRSRPAHSGAVSRAAQDLRRPGGDCDRERALFKELESRNRDLTDCLSSRLQQRYSAGYQPVTNRCSAGLRSLQRLIAAMPRQRASSLRFDGNDPFSSIANLNPEEPMPGVTRFQAPSPRHRGHASGILPAALRRFPMCCRIALTINR